MDNTEPRLVKSRTFAHFTEREYSDGSLVYRSHRLESSVAGVTARGKALTHKESFKLLTDDEILELMQLTGKHLK